MENSAQIPNPLIESHSWDDVETQTYGRLEIVSTFGQPQLEYAALHKSCGIIDLPFRGVLQLTGRDRNTFLNGLISNQTWDKETKQPMPSGSWVYAFLLNLRGRIVADMNVIELGDVTLVETDATLVAALADVLEKYRFSEKVEMIPHTHTQHRLALLGPKSVEVLEQITDMPVELPGLSSAARVTIGGTQCVAWRDAPTGTDGIQLLVPTADALELWRRFAGAVEDDPARLARPVGWAAFNSCRIEAGRALFGIDFPGVAPASAYPDRKSRDSAIGDEAGPGILPAETGRLFKQAVNLSKCYIGQEIVARMYARQQAARMIVGFRMADDDCLPLAGAPVLDGSGTQVGIVTSSTLSPVQSNAAIGLAFIKKPHFAVGAELTIPAEGKMRRASVVDLPLRSGAQPAELVEG